MDPVEIQVPQNAPAYPGQNYGGGYYQQQPVLGQSLEHSAAKSIDTISGCGGVSTVLVLVFLLSVAFNVLQYIMNRKTVEKMLDLMPNAAASIQAAVNDFKESLKDALSSKSS